MTIVKISPKYQVVIPKEIRKHLKIKPGQRLQVVEMEDKLELVPLRNIKEARGFLKGMDTGFKREKDRI
jgi:AbrB family looped-hinge helix DNA binding protein